MPRWILVIAGGAIAVVFVIAFSRNFACAALPACVAVMAVVAFIPPFRLSGASAFRTVFGMSPPPGVRNLTAESRYAGGPGDHVILLSFHADQLAIDQLIGKLGADVDRRYTQVWDADAGRDWSRFLLDRNVKV